ncbi:MAG: substrate-binding domain-containing protein [Kiritimatiellae bacterium]|nr:substrate-binding domain-containing protein [Kiritimatiellia bacterium]MBR0057513.1 substrate-binding domain-containing protein [Kiritimatiellia bacterium]
MAVLIDLVGAAGRSMLSGISRFLSEGHLWRLEIFQLPDAPAADALRRLERDGLDGYVVTDLGPPDGVDVLSQSRLPAVFVNVSEERFARRRGGTAFIWNDNDDIGRRAAAHLLGCGNFASYGFVNAFVRQRFWSEPRGKAFRRAMADAGFAVADYPMRDDCGSAADAAALRDWLAALPKPAAIFATADWRAVQVVDAAQAAGIRIPGQIVLLGTDDSEFECLGVVPQLSSVQPDYEGAGYRAAAELEALIASRRPGPPRRIALPARTVVSRGSTKPIPPATMLVRRGLAFIHAHACERISPEDVATHLGVSRRLAELRFRQLCGKTVYGAIEVERLERVKKMLLSTDRPIVRIAEMTGFRSANRLSILFKQRFKLSPRAWRAARGR